MNIPAMRTTFILTILCLLIGGVQPNQAFSQTGLQFNGSNQYVTFGSASGLGVANMTLEVWFYRSGAGVTVSTGSGGVTALPLVTKGRGEGDGSNLDMNFFLGIASGSNVLCADFEEGTGTASPGLNHPVYGVTSIRNGVWNHAAVTFDTTANRWRLYLNGILEKDTVIGSGRRFPQYLSIQHAGLATAMTSNGTAAGFFSGIIDEARIWNYVRSQQSIVDSMSIELSSAVSGLVGRFGLNEGSGSIANNTVPAGVNGTLMNTPSWVSGSTFVSPKALGFGGTNGFVTFDRAPGLGVATFTIETWFKREATGRTTYTGTGGITAIPLITKGRFQADGDARDMNFFLGINGSNNVLSADFEEGNGSNSPGLNHPVFGITPISNGIWYHAAVTYDSSQKRWRLYLNGNLEKDTVISALSCFPQYNSLQHAGLATAFDTSGVDSGKFAGVLDEARIWNVVRTQAEIQALINTQLTTPTAGLLARWGFDETAGKTVSGSAGTSFTGSIKGTDWGWADAAPFNISYTPPDAPSGFSATAIASYRIDLAWTDNSSNETSFEIERSTTGSGGPFTLLATVVQNTVSYSNIGTSPLTEYCYRVRAVNSGGSSAYTSVACATTPAETNSALQFGGTNDYVTFGTAMGLASQNFTIETWFKRTGTGVSNTTGSGGVTLVPIIAKGAPEADGSVVDANYILGIATGNVLAADFEEGTGSASPGLNHPVVGTTVIVNDLWYHAAATFSNGVFSLYLNGVLEASLNLGASVWPQGASTQYAGFGTMQTSGGTRLGYFQGVVDEIRVWNYARSLSQIQSAINTPITSYVAGLLGRYSFNEGTGTTVNASAGTSIHGTIGGTGYAWTSGAPFNLVVNTPPATPVLVSPSNGATGVSSPATLSVSVTDPDNDTLTVSFYGRPVTSSGSDFAIVVIPDAQNYTAGLSGGTNAMFKSQTQWVMNNLSARNIVYVNQAGDITNDGDTYLQQWLNADTAMSILENPSPGVPYGISIGNHDQIGGTTYYNQFFGVSRFSGRPYYGGNYGSNNNNNFQLFSGGGMDFVAINLERGASAGALHWADSLLKAYASRRAIVFYHELINTGYPATWSGPGQTVYDSLKDNPNLFMLHAGHVPGEGRRADTYNGTTINTLLADYQSRTNGGNGWLRILEFSPSGNIIHVRTYTSWLDQWETDGDSQFDLSYNMNGSAYQLVGTNTAVPSGSTTSIQWNGLNPGIQYEWYATVNDSVTTATGPTWSFTTQSSGPSHTITASAVGSGVITPSGSVIVGEGGSQTFAVTPSGGYHLDSLVVDGANLGVRSGYTFTNVLTDHSITAYFAANLDYADSYLLVTPLQQLTTTSETGEKPQSKVWYHDARWWSVLSTSAGTFIHRLDGTTWTSVFQLSTATDVRADAKVVGNVVHILLYRGVSSELASAEYSPSTHTYQSWSVRSGNVALTLDSGVETATIDIDSQGRMWLASDAESDMNVRWSDSPYSTWNSPVTVGTGTSSDDICVLTALPTGKIGLLWSNQNTRRFGFRIHTDGTNPTVWSDDEIPASHSAQNVGLGMADDHLNLAVASDGTLYAAVKTSYDTPGYPKVSLLVRHPWGAWDDLYTVDEAGTRAVVMLNEPEQTLTVVYTSAEGYNPIVYKRSSLHPISFGPRRTLISGAYNNVTTMKQNDVADVVYLASNTTTSVGVLAATVGPDLVGHWAMDEGSGALLVDSSVYKNNGTIFGSPLWVSGIRGTALALNGSLHYATVVDTPSLDLTNAMTMALWVRPEVYGTQDLIKKAINGSVDGYELALAAPSSTWPNRPFFRFNQASSLDAYRLSARASSVYPTDGSWMHIAATYDGTTMKLYINGVLDTSRVVSTSAAVNSLALGIGSQSDAQRKFTGRMDDVRIYNRALTASEIESLSARMDTIIATAGPNGTIAPNGTVLVTHGMDQVFTIAPASGYFVDSLIVDGVKVDSTSSYTFAHVVTNHTIRAVFEQYVYTIEATAGPNGSISPAGTVAIPYGSGQTFTITPGVGYEVDSLLVDGALVDSTLSYTFVNVTASHTIRAVFAQLQYAITASAGANGSISPAGAVVVNYGGSQIFTCTPNTGYHIDSLIVDGTPVPPAPTYTFSNVTAGHTIRVVFAIDLFTIEASAGTNGTIDPPGSVAVVYGSSQSFSITPNAGYRIDSLLVDGVAVDSTTSYTFVNVTTNHTIRAVFAMLQFTITASAGLNGTIDPSGIISVVYGSSQTFTITPDTGYHIDSLLIDGMSISPLTSYGFTNIEADHTIRAVFAINMYSLTVSTSGSGSVARVPDLPSYPHGSQVVLGAVADAGFVFTGWSGDLSGTANPETIIVNGPKSVSAFFSALSGITVATDPPGLQIIVDGVPSTSPGVFNWIVGSNHTIAVTSPQGGGGTRHEFSSWSDGGAISHTITTPASPITYTATFATKYLLTTSSAPAPGGTVTASPLSPDGYYASGTTVQLTATAATGFGFSSWSGDLTGSANPASVVMNAARAVVANFVSVAGISVTTDPVGLSLTVDGESYVAPQSFTWVVGSTHTIATSSPQGSGGVRYVFNNWSDGGAITHQITVPSGSTTYTANFTTQMLLTTAVTPVGSGTVVVTPSSADGYYDAGTNVQLTASPGIGFSFSNWSGDLTGSTNPAIVAMSSPRSVTANFQTASFLIQATAGPHGSITPSGSVTVLYGSDQTFTITPDVGYAIDSLLVDGVPTSPSGTYTFTTVTADHSIQAVFVDTVQVISVLSSWNLLSVPRAVQNVPDYLLFPTAVSRAFEFSNGYAATPLLTNGRGYWMKFETAGDVPVPGMPLRNVTIALAPKWNMIGAIAVPVSVQSVLQNPPGLVTSQYFGYDNGYYLADVLEPGKGYWVKAASSGTLEISGTLQSSHTKPVIEGAEKEQQGLTLSFQPGNEKRESKGRTRSLYVMEDKEAAIASGQYDMPPIPPQGAVDIRFASDRMAENVDAHMCTSVEIPLNIQPADKIFVMEYERKSDARLLYSLIVRDGEGSVESHRLSSTGTITLPGSKDRVISLRVEPLPQQFALLQNYPNPFNPRTTVRFLLSEPSLVTLRIFNVLGQEVDRLMAGGKEAGEYQVSWNAAEMPSGVYFYRLEATSVSDPTKTFTQTRKMVLMR